MKLIILINLLNVLDIVSTSLVLHFNKGHESNPIVISLFNNLGFEFTIILKLIIVFLMSLIIHNLYEDIHKGKVEIKEAYISMSIIVILIILFGQVVISNFLILL